jgi:hypothetical protein
MVFLLSLAALALLVVHLPSAGQTLDPVLRLALVVAFGLPLLKACDDAERGRPLREGIFRR